MTSYSLFRFLRTLQINIERKNFPVIFPRLETETEGSQKYGNIFVTGVMNTISY